MDKYTDLLASIEARGGRIGFKEACDLFGLELIYEAVEQLEGDELVLTYGRAGDPETIYSWQTYQMLWKVLDRSVCCSNIPCC